METRRFNFVSVNGHDFINFLPSANHPDDGSCILCVLIDYVDENNHIIPPLDRYCPEAQHFIDFELIKRIINNKI